MRSKHVIAVCVAGLLLATLTAIPLTAAANSHKRFVIAIRGNLTGDTSAAGTFTGDGAISSSGTIESSFTAEPTSNKCFAIKADWTFTAADGSFSFHGSGRSCSSVPDGPHAIGDFRFTISAGTGAYAGLAGKGTATGVTDFADEGAITTVFDGTARAAH